MKRLLFILLLTASMLQAETLNELLRLAEDNNPAIAAAENLWLAAGERTTIAGSLPDPRLSYGRYLEEVQTRTGPQEQKAGISQTFPMFGKRELRKESAEHSAEELYARYRAIRADTLFRLKQNWFELAYLDRALETEQDRLHIFQTLEKTAERTVENGGDARNLLDIRITLIRIKDQLQTLQSKQHPLEAKINALLNRDRSTPVAPQEPLSLKKPFSDPLLNLQESNPAINEQRAVRARWQAEKKLTKRNRLPDITLGADWIQTGDGGDDPLIIGISLNLPLWFSKNKAEQLSASYEFSAQEARLQNQINRLQALLTDHLSRRDDTTRRAELYATELIPSAEQHFKLTRTAYENDTADLRELTASEERLLSLRLMFERSLADRAIAVAEIEKILGGAEVPPPKNRTGASEWKQPK